MATLAAEKPPKPPARRNGFLETLERSHRPVRSAEFEFPEAGDEIKALSIISSEEVVAASTWRALR
jgi:hypothetical protein